MFAGCLDRKLLPRDDDDDDGGGVVVVVDSVRERLTRFRPIEIVFHLLFVPTEQIRPHNPVAESYMNLIPRFFPSVSSSANRQCS